MFNGWTSQSKFPILGFFCISTLTKILFTVYIWDFYQTWGPETRSMNIILIYSCCNSQFRVHDVPDIFHRRKIWSAGRAVGAECPAVCWLLAVSKCTTANDGPSTITNVISVQSVDNCMVFFVPQKHEPDVNFLIEKVFKTNSKGRFDVAVNSAEPNV